MRALVRASEPEKTVNSQEKTRHEPLTRKGVKFSWDNQTDKSSVAKLVGLWSLIREHRTDLCLIMLFGYSLRLRLIQGNFDHEALCCEPLEWELVYTAGDFYGFLMLD